MPGLLVNILTNCLFAVILIGLVFLVTSRWRSPFLAHALWMVVLLKLVVAPFSIIGVPVIPAVENTMDSASLARTQPVDTSPDRPQRITESFGATPGHSGLWILKDTNWIFVVWSAGSTYLLLLVIVRSIRFRRMLQRLPDAPPDLQERVQTLAARLSVKHPPQVKMTNTITPPLLWAFARRPYLVLPSSLTNQLASRELDTLLMHELVHLKRRAHRSRSFEALAMGLYWWNPLVWLAKKQLHQACELCCDAMVVDHCPDHARDYGETLLKTVNFISNVRLTNLPVGANAIGRTPQLVRRIEMILANPTAAGLRPRYWAIVLAATLLAIPVSATPFQRDVSDTENQDNNVDRTTTLDGASTGDADESKVDPQEPKIRPEWERWKIEYSAADRDEYASILQSFDIYLGVVSQTSNRIDFLTELTEEKATVKTGTRQSDEAQVIYFRNTKASLREWDKAIVQDAGLELDEKVIVLFYPKEIRNKLLERELAICTKDNKEPSEVKSVSFGCRPQEADEGFEYFVKEIQYRPRPN